MRANPDLNLIHELYSLKQLEQNIRFLYTKLCSYTTKPFCNHVSYASKQERLPVIEIDILLAQACLISTNPRRTKRMLAEFLLSNEKEPEHSKSSH